jgi:hypothetical protein
VTTLRTLVRKKRFWAGLVVALFFTLPALDDGCGTHEPWSKRRPRNVPKEAFYVPVVKGYWYVQCWLDHDVNVNRCRVYHSDGTLLLEDVYLPYEGIGPVPADRLRITHQTGTNGPRIVYLRSGEILISRSDYENQKRFLDWTRGKRRSSAGE